MRSFASISTCLFAFVTGCGDDGGVNKLPDAPLAPDGPTPDSIPSGTVNVTTMAPCCDVAANTPEPNIVVISLSAEGTLVATATTGADGKASIEVREGGSVSAVYPEDETHNNRLQTFVGVKPNDNLTFGEGYFTPNVSGANGNMTVNWPAFPNTMEYRVANACMSSSSSSLTIDLSLYDYCQTATSPIALLAIDANYNIIASAYLPTAATAPGSVIPSGDVTWVAQTQDNSTVSITGLNSVVNDVYLSAYGEYPFYIGYGGSSNWVGPKAGAASQTFTTSSTAPYKYARAELYRSGNFGRQDYLKGGASPYAMTATALPWIDGEKLISFAQRRLIWFETTGDYDAATLDLHWSRYDKKTSHYYTWTLILPPKVADFRFPTPPSELAAFQPTEMDSVSSYLQLVDLSSASSYDAARALPFWRVTDPYSAVRSGDEPSAAISYDGEGYAAFTD